MQGLRQHGSGLPFAHVTIRAGSVGSVPSEVIQGLSSLDAQLLPRGTSGRREREDTKDNPVFTQSHADITHLTCPHFHGNALVMWPHLAAREAGKGSQ